VIEQEKKLYEQFSKNKQSHSLNASHPVSSSNGVSLMGSQPATPAAIPAGSVSQAIQKPAEMKPGETWVHFDDHDSPKRNLLNQAPSNKR